MKFWYGIVEWNIGMEWDIFLEWNVGRVAHTILRDESGSVTLITTSPKAIGSHVWPFVLIVCLLVVT